MAQIVCHGGDTDTKARIEDEEQLDQRERIRRRKLAVNVNTGDRTAESEGPP